MRSPADSSPMLEIEDLIVERGGTRAVQKVSLRVRREEIAALLGPSGCGKTTLLRTVAGFEHQLEGTVRIDGETVSDGACWVEPQDRRVGMVFQQGALFPHMTVEQNLRYGLDRHPEGERLARETLDLVGLGRLSRRYPDQLSGGQQQLVALGRALAPRPRIVLLDEPFASLDASLRLRLREDVMRILRETGCTAVLVTHDQAEALSLADRVAVMREGRILQVGTPEEIYRHPQNPEVARFIGDGEILDCAVQDGRLSCELGSWATQEADGPREILVRPEALELLPPDSTSGTPATVIRRSYYGHDLLIEVELGSGLRLPVRAAAPQSVPLGARVRLRLRSTDLHLFG